MQIFLDKRGVTLAELLVSVMLTVFITAITIGSLNPNNQEDRTNYALQDVRGLIATAYSLAFASVTDEESGGVPFGYGVYFTNQDIGGSQALIFTDKNNNKKFDTNEEITSTIKTLHKSLFYVNSDGDRVASDAPFSFSYLIPSGKFVYDNLYTDYIENGFFVIRIKGESGKIYLGELSVDTKSARTEIKDAELIN